MASQSYQRSILVYQCHKLEYIDHMFPSSHEKMSVSAYMTCSHSDSTQSAVYVPLNTILRARMTLELQHEYDSRMMRSER